MVKSVYVRRAVPSDKLAIVDNLLAANAEAELEVEPVSIVDTVAAVEKVLADPSSNTRVLVAEKREMFAAHAAFQPHFSPICNGRYYCSEARVVSGFRSLGIGRQLLTSFQGVTHHRINLKALVPSCSIEEISFARSLGLKPRECDLMALTVDGPEIQKYRCEYSVRNATSGEQAIVVAGNEAFEISRARGSPINEKFLVSAMARLYSQVYGIFVNDRDLGRGVGEALATQVAGDGSYFILTPYHKPDKPVGCLWMFEETSLFRPISRVYIRDLWLEKSHRRMRLAKPFVQSSLALFCTTESKVEIRALLMERILRRGAIGEACKAAAKSLRLENRGRRILLEP